MDDVPAPQADESGSAISIDIEGTEADTVVRVSGDLDFATAPTLAEALAPLTADRSGRILVDCSQITFMDSSGLNVLVKAWNETGTSDASVFAIAEPSRQVTRVIEICGVAGIIDGR